MKDFLDKLQKDLTKLQKTIQKEGDDLLKLAKRAGSKENLQARRTELETKVAEKVRQFEPTVQRFIKEVSANVKKAGIDVSQLEAKLSSAAKAAGDRFGTGKKSRGKASTARKTTAKKAPATKTAKPKAVRAKKANGSAQS